MPLTPRQSTVWNALGLGPQWQLQATPPPNDLSSLSVTQSPPPPTRGDTIAVMTWEALDEAIANCQACGLCQTRQQTVMGVGDRQAQWLIVGEAPGAEEDKRGEPFVGKAGQLLDNMLRTVGKQRHQGVYIANVLKCRPPNNRNPEMSEIVQCRPFLQRQIALIQPQVIIAVGKFAAQTLLNTSQAISKLRGQWHDYAGIPLLATFHPAYLLRSPTEKAKAWQDWLQVAQRAAQDKGNSAF